MLENPKPERGQKRNLLPFDIRPRSDYILESDGKIISSVELKAPYAINKDCIVPLMLQLLKIQHYQQDPSAQYLGILTDGYKYVLIYLQGSKFTFERDPEGKKTQVKVHKAKTWADVIAVMNVLCDAVENCINSKNNQKCRFFQAETDIEDRGPRPEPSNANIKAAMDTIIIDDSD